MKRKKTFVENGRIGVGLMLIGMALPLLKCYALAPQYFWEAFSFLA